jgi:Uma2 family endonuclease
MQVALEELNLPAKLVFDSDAGLSLDKYLVFCEQNPELRSERTAEGEIILVPPAGGESDYRCLELGGQLRDWARKNRSGKVFGSSVEFILPDESALSPDAAWVSDERLGTLTKEQRRQFLRVAPNFVVEVLSPSDRLPTATAKMRQWTLNGVELAWLIDGDRREVHIYRPGREPEIRNGIETLSGEGALETFTADLTDIWEGL